MHEQEDIFEITTSTDTFQSWAEKDFVNDDIRDEIINAAVLIVPTVGFRNTEGPSFPPGTQELLAYLKANMPAEFPVDICVSDEFFATLSLHSDYKRLGDFNVKVVALTLFINVLSGYIVNKISAIDNAKPQINVINNITNVVNPDTNAVKKTKKHKNHVPHKFHEPSKITVSITVHDTTGRSLKYDYRGAAKDFGQVSDKIKQDFVDGH